MDIAAICRAVNSIVTPAYLVGGSVRDFQLGITAKDYDFCTPLSPDDVELAVKSAGRHVYRIGKRYGTIGCKLNGNFVEITTFRQEQYTPGSRHPRVEFVEDLNADLSRRDFTMNAMAMKVEKNVLELIDPCNGQKGIHSKIIRAVGSPSERIKEDPLRMLRAARFAAQLNFAIESELLADMKKKAHKIYEVSKERWVAELDKLLIGKNPGKGLQALADTGLLKHVLPELWLQVGYDQDSPYHSMDLWNHTKKTVEHADEDVEMRWAALLHDVGKPFAKTRNDKGYSNYTMHEKISAELTLGIAYRLKWSTVRREHVHQLVLHHLEDNSPLRPADNIAT